MGAVVTGPTRGAPTDRPASAHPAIVWIDARTAVVADWRDGSPVVERFESDVPAHHRSTGHVRHDPTMRHGGGGRPQDAGEPHRLEHLARFVERIAQALPVDADVLVLGPGSVRERLERRLREADEHHGRSRAVTGEPSARLSERQLVARLRGLAGAEPPRRTVGAWRWSRQPNRRPSGTPEARPARVAEKPEER